MSPSWLFFVFSETLDGFLYLNLLLIYGGVCVLPTGSDVYLYCIHTYIYIYILQGIRDWPWSLQIVWDMLPCFLGNAASVSIQVCTVTFLAFATWLPPFDPSGRVRENSTVLVMVVSSWEPPVTKPEGLVLDLFKTWGR